MAVLTGWPRPAEITHSGQPHHTRDNRANWAHKPLKPKAGKCWQTIHTWFDKVARDIIANHKTQQFKAIASCGFFLTKLTIRHSRNEKGNVGRNASRSCFWNCYWRHACVAVGQFFSLSLLTVPEVFAKVNWAPVFIPFLKWRNYKRTDQSPFHHSHHTPSYLICSTRWFQMFE